MADHDALSQGGDIDLDRVIVDPDYRRVVIAMLRQAEARDQSEAATAEPSEPAPENG
jgi:hypothetical protein